MTIIKSIANLRYLKLICFLCDHCKKELACINTTKKLTKKEIENWKKIKIFCNSKEKKL